MGGNARQNQPRQPRGTPVGGQWDTTAGGGAATDLSAWDWDTITDESAAVEPDPAAAPDPAPPEPGPWEAGDALDSVSTDADAEQSGEPESAPPAASPGSGVQDAAGADADGFTWTRIESMMGRDFLLDAERTAKMPKINASDNVAQVQAKLVRYVSATQDLSGVADEEVCARLGYEPAAPGEFDEAWARKAAAELGAGGGRVLVAKTSEGRLVLLSATSAFTKTGSFYDRRERVGFEAHNVAALMVASDFEKKFLAEHPQWEDPVSVDLLRRLPVKAYSAKKHAGMWDETLYGEKVTAAIGAGLLDQAQADGTLDQFPRTPEALRARVEAMGRPEIDAALARLETKTSRRYMAERDPATGKMLDTTRDVLRYKVPLQGTTYFVDVDEAAMELDGLSVRSRRAAMLRDYRAFLEDQMALEYDFQLSREYVRRAAADHNATVFQDKKDIPQSHLDAAAKGRIAQTGDFAHIEIDEGTDLNRYRAIEDEYGALRRYLPKTTRPDLRFRLTGRHRAIGVYHPHADNIAVDPRHPESFVHEFTHHVDHTAGGRNISASEEFRPILRAAQANIHEAKDRGEFELQKPISYWETPSEVLSRTAELYFYWKKPGTSLNGDGGRYDDHPGYTTLLPLKEQIIAFWDDKLANMGADVPDGQPFQP